jgi:hypothetical protein
MSKTRVNISLDQDLVEFAKLFAAENRMTLADIFNQYLLALKRQEDRQDLERVLANPAFQKAMDEVQEKIRSGRAKWHNHDEVFKD